MRSVNDGLSKNIQEKKREKSLDIRGLNIRSVGTCLRLLQVSGGFPDNPSLMDQKDLLEITESVPYSMYFAIHQRNHQERWKI